MKEIFDSFLTTIYLHLKINIQYFADQIKGTANVQNYNIRDF